MTSFDLTSMISGGGLSRSRLINTDVDVKLVLVNSATQLHDTLLEYILVKNGKSPMLSGISATFRCNALQS